VRCDSDDRQGAAVSSDESRRNIVARVHGKTVWVTGGPSAWTTEPYGKRPIGSPSPDTMRRTPDSVEEALAATEARASDSDWNYAAPTPREVALNIEIENAGNGYLLICAAADGSLHPGDTWHATLDDAEDSALVDFGVQAHEWQRQL
jgi:hypothetical protein